MRITDRIWNNEAFSEYAVLSFVINRATDEVLLILKKRGFGKGKISAPGGRIDPGESDFKAAIRETTEEVCITPVNPKKTGELNFYFLDGYSLKVYVFASEKWTGEICETVEAKPFWCKTAEIPYEKMWTDDQYWLPFMLEGKKISGYFIFDNDKMLDKEIIIDENLSLEYDKKWHNSLR